MPNYIEYHKSVAAEFMAYEKRVGHLIDDAHRGEEGRYKEIILMNYLKRILPKHISVGTGFVRNKNVISKQIDIIIYDQSYPLLFAEGDFIIATPENVIGIIEVKSGVEPSCLGDIIKKANKNAAIICGDSDKKIFNGIFSFNSHRSSKSYINNLRKTEFNEVLDRQHFNQICSNKLYSCVNHIMLGNKYFVKLWPSGEAQEYHYKEWRGESPHYTFYDMQDGLGIAYFLSNLQEQIIRFVTNQYIESLPDTMQSFLYPIPEGKRTRVIERVQLK